MLRGNAVYRLKITDSYFTSKTFHTINTQLSGWTFKPSGFLFFYFFLQHIHVYSGCLYQVLLCFWLPGFVEASIDFNCWFCFSLQSRQWLCLKWAFGLKQWINSLHIPHYPLCTVTHPCWWSLSSCCCVSKLTPFQPLESSVSDSLAYTFTTQSGQKAM